MHKYIYVIFLACSSFLFSLTAVAGLPVGSSFIALDGGAWRFFIVEANGVRRVNAILDPRQAVWSPSRQEVVYLSVEGAVRRFSLKSMTDTVMVLPESNDAFTQFAFVGGGSRLIAVKLFNRKSETAMLVYWDETKMKFEILSEKRGASFDPVLKGEGLLYSFASCVVGCGNIIHDIWIKDVISGSARQLTKLNAISRQPIFMDDNTVIFSSNAKGNYHLWRYKIDEDAASSITDGFVTDVDPIVDKKNDIYFIRRTGSKGKFMRLTDGVVTQLSDHGHWGDVRNLELAL